MSTFLEHLPCLTNVLGTLLGQIPRGKVTTYGDLAEALGDLSAARWVAEALTSPGGHAHGADCACHRVIRRTGELGRFQGENIQEKQQQLEREGVTVSAGKVSEVNRWHSFQIDPPLRRLAEWQRNIASRVRQVSLSDEPDVIAGFDAAYTDDRIVAACVVMSFPDLSVIDTFTEVERIQFPYLPGYLAFRELPTLWTLWQRVSEHVRPELLLVDGNGRLHPRRAGIACCLGVLTDVPTIGIGKSLLCGRVDPGSTRCSDGWEWSAVLAGEEWLGDRLQKASGGRPIYLSVGHRIDRAAIRSLLPRLGKKHRLPEVLHQADRLSKETVRRLRSGG